MCKPETSFWLRKNIQSHVYYHFMLDVCVNSLHLISLGERPREEGPVASMEEQLDNNFIGEETLIQEDRLCYFTVREADEARMAGLLKTEESKSNKLFKLKEDVGVV